MAQLILKGDYDICLFTEVGGPESLDNFNNLFLAGKYTVVHQNSNSDRGIDLGILIKNEYQNLYKEKFHSHKVFARGVHQIELYLNENKRYRFLLTHLKSKLSRTDDFEGRSTRQKEVSKLVEIYHKAQAKAEMPTYICGDLNGIIYKDDTEPELSLFAANNLYDCFEHLDKSEFERSSYVYFNKQKQPILMQLDYILVDSKWKDQISSDSAILDFDGNIRSNIPISMSQKFQMPSDHFPIRLKIII